MSADPQLKKKIEDILRAEFPGETVDVSDGYGENIHVIIVSRKFDGMRETEKQDRLWSVIDKGGLSDFEKTRISMILPYSPSDLK